MNIYGPPNLTDPHDRIALPVLWIDGEWSYRGESLGGLVESDVHTDTELHLGTSIRSTGILPGSYSSSVLPKTIDPPGGMFVLSAWIRDAPKPVPASVSSPGSHLVGTLTVYDLAHPPGMTADFPLLPDIVGDAWQFGMNVTDATQPVFIDPAVAIGYDYFVDSGPNFGSVLLPSLSAGDNLYDLWLWDTVAGTWTDAGTDIAAGSQYDFAPGGVDRFRILGIEAAAGLDPQNDLAFVTGLWFTNTGSVTMRQVPISFDTQPVPAPGAIALGSLGALLVGWLRRHRTL